MKHIYQAWQEFYKSSKKNTRTRITVLLVAIFISNFVFGQEKLPVSVNNIKYFSPPRSQNSVANCTHFSLIHFLKSAIWNRYYGLDPLSKENQFNENFVWDQNIDPIYRNSNFESAFEFMKDQGCAKATDFDFDETSDQTIPSLDVRVKALAFKSKAIHKMFICRQNGLDLLNEQMHALKDSLSQGICFVSSIFLYPSYFNLNQNYNVYNCDYDKSKLNDRVNHAVTIVGYNDTIRTTNGRGAFLVLNSNDSPGKAIFWFPYEWYYSQEFAFNVVFLEEDFNSSPAKLTLNLKLSNLVTSAQMGELKNFFTDTVFDQDGKKFDYPNYLDYFYRRNEIKLLAINNKRISVYNQTRVFFPFNSKDGSYQILKDLSDLSKPEDFKSLKVLFSDPISATYIGKNGETLYSFNREAKGIINEAYVSFVETNKKIVAKIENLPDTTIIIDDSFFCYPIIMYSGNSEIFPYGFVKSCTSTIKRQLITFTVEDLLDYTLVRKVEQSEFGLTVYPNPATDVATFEILLPKKESLQLKVFNSHGQQVAVIANREFEAGTHQIVFDSKGLPDGIYIGCLQTPSGIKTVKLIKSARRN